MSDIYKDNARYQTAIDRDASALGSDGVFHVIEVDDMTPICGRHDEGFVLTEHTDEMTAAALGKAIIGGNYLPMCGTCSQEFWDHHA
jgi:hypothetical protein